MTNEQIQALMDKFETAVMERICISKSTLIGLRTDEGYRNSTLSGHDYHGDWEFFLAGYSCSLVNRDADKALIAEQEKRIAELEQRHCGGALMEREEHHVGVVNKLLERIAELEARTLTVKLPRDITHVTNKYFEEGRDAVLEAIESQLAAAGITLDVGE